MCVGARAYSRRRVHARFYRRFPVVILKIELLNHLGPCARCRDSAAARIRYVGIQGEDFRV